MATTITRIPDGEDVWGRTHVKVVDVTLDNSYPATNGYVINANDVGLKGIRAVQVVGGNKAAGKLNFLADLLGTGVAGQDVTAVALRAFFPSGGAGTAPTSLAAPVITEGAITNGAISIAASTATPDAGGTPVTSTGAQPAIPVVFGAITQAASSIAAGSATPGVAKEVGNTADLSTIIVRLMIFGR